MKSLPFTIDFYEAPHRILKTLKSILEVMGDRLISVSREISKIHEEVFRGKVSEALVYYKDVKGEFVIVVERGNSEINYQELIGKVSELVQLGISSKDAIKKIAKDYKVSKNILYDLYEEVKK